MCLILFSYNHHPHYKLILASNRDEFYDRPTKPLGKWGKNKNILAGQDKMNSGTWLGVTADWKISAITNYRDLSNVLDNAPSRGLLVRNFLENNESPINFVEKSYLKTALGKFETKTLRFKRNVPNETLNTS